eukprot:scaffold40515_cov61-Phaeocystis_antarctica.AAC.4
MALQPRQKSQIGAAASPCCPRRRSTSKRCRFKATSIRCRLKADNGLDTCIAGKPQSLSAITRPGERGRHRWQRTLPTTEEEAFFLTGLPPDLALLVAAWNSIDLMMRFLPTTEEEAFFLTGLPPDLALLVAAWNSIDLMMRFLPTTEEEAFFLMGLPPDLALLVAAWVDLVTRFLPTTEEEAFFLMGLPPDLALLVAAWIDLVFFSPTLGHLRKRLAFERCVCTAFCTEVARYLQDCLVSLYVHRIAARPLAPADERATGIISITGIVTKLPRTWRRAAMLHLENQEQSLTLRLNEMKWHRSHILHCATHSLNAIH